MKFLRSILIGGVLLTRLHALESAEITAVAKRFDAPTGDEQYQARIELNRLVAQATLPGKGDCAAVTQILVAAMQSPDTSKEASKYLIRALARIATVEAVAPLAKIMAGPDPRLKEEARAALSWIPAPQAVAVLEGALAKTTDPREKIALIEALATPRVASAVPLLAPMILDADPALARAAMTALARIGGPAAVTALTTAQANSKMPAALKPDAERALLVASAGEPKTALAIYQSSASDTVKLAAFIALMKNAPESAQPGLIEAALKSQDPGLRQVALARGIALSLPSLQASLAQSLDSWSKEERLIVLANLGHFKPAATAEKIALSRVTSAEEDERIGALTALGKFPTQAAFQAVLQAIGEHRVNQAAANALANMTYPAAEATLLAMLKGSSSPDRILALKAMVARQLPEANTILLDIIKGGDKDAAKEAMKTLYPTATIDDLRTLCAAATATQDADLRKNLVSICSRIASRLKTPEALALVKDLK